MKNNQKPDVFTVTQRMVKTYQDIISKQCMRNDNGVLTVSDEDKKIVRKSKHEKLLST